jgi:hypothetical protein
MMTRAEAFRLTVERCDAMLEEQLARTECLLLDLGATAEELEAAIGPSLLSLGGDGAADRRMERRRPFSFGIRACRGSLYRGGG